ncbi:hypothetical protein [Bacillus licheniformis]|uniref:hypothetical protein n=1 Tax=Bacillus licheniformis TaxID=1402 RepID=UPI0011BD912D|nr:hypothetical protein [Bacillus licheniformis]MED0689967.1 hypothetical protein [Bacillus licheniformis]MED0713575.1 hypothetical protein [Bacillus licheniformis]MED0789308.1 hypothetical protein [Bacillus licheniformis]WIW99391.1 hypothetical protein QQ984_03665 [Bacillus licheniformis]
MALFQNKSETIFPTARTIIVIPTKVSVPCGNKMRRLTTFDCGNSNACPNKKVMIDRAMGTE